MFFPSSNLFCTVLPLVVRCPVNQDTSRAPLRNILKDCPVSAVHGTASARHRAIPSPLTCLSTKPWHTLPYFAKPFTLCASPYYFWHPCSFIPSVNCFVRLANYDVYIPPVRGSFIPSASCRATNEGCAGLSWWTLNPLFVTDDIQLRLYRFYLCTVFLRVWFEPEKNRIKIIFQHKQTCRRTLFW